MFELQKEGLLFKLLVWSAYWLLKLHINYFGAKLAAFCGVMCVTLIRFPFKHENCDQYHLLFSWYVHFPECFDYFVLTNSFGLEKIQSLLLYLKSIRLKHLIKDVTYVTRHNKWARTLTWWKRWYFRKNEYISHVLLAKVSSLWCLNLRYWWLLSPWTLLQMLLIFVFNISLYE